MPHIITIIKFLTNENVELNDILQILRAQFGNETLSKLLHKFLHGISLAVEMMHKI